MALYAELHRHLGGSVVPRVLWRYFERHTSELISALRTIQNLKSFIPNLVIP